jgi:lipid-binding SYLF domain-containing protein
MNSVIRWAAGICLAFVVGMPMAVAEGVTSAQVKETIKAFEAKDPSIKSRFKSAYGYAVFPDLGKAGVIIGGGGGDGLVFERGRMIGSAEVSQITVGAQVGVQHYSELIFFENKATLDRFKANKLEFDANASAVVAKSGASSSAPYRNGVAVFSIAKEGVMVEAAIGGQKFTFHPQGR